MILPPDSLVSYVLSLPPRERLVSLYAMRIAFPILVADDEWREYIRGACALVKPGKREHQAIVEESHRVAVALKEAMGKGA